LKMYFASVRRFVVERTQLWLQQSSELSQKRL